MRTRALNILVSVIVAGLFIWLAVRNIDPAELWSQMKSVTLYWLPFFVVVMLVSHYLRAERWRLLLGKDYTNISRSTLFAGVMIGYLFNNIVPRLGEISRPVYVARKENLSASNLVGTIVVERLLDLATLFLLFFVVSFFIIETELLQQLFGIQNWNWYHYLAIPVVLLAVVAVLWIFFRVLQKLERKNTLKSPVLSTILQKTRSFNDGLASFKHVQNWPLFILLTGGIWAGYVLMTWLPFHMMTLQDLYSLGPAEALVLTLVSSVGVSIPVPAGIGSYHLFIQQSMWLFYKVPLVTALTYATIAHGITVLLIFLFAPLALWWDKYHTLNTHATR